MFDYILSLGGTVFVPIIMIIIGLIFRIPWLQAVKAGVTVGIGFVGMGLVIVMAIDSLSPPIKVMIERFGLTLHVFDVGAGPASGVGYATHRRDDHSRYLSAQRRYAGDSSDQNHER